ncbi:SDR family NAD(P)-dependent oxidoreductase [Nocardioides sp. SYSU DS0663]|uniref:SDR family NAD(P)-dependent oxidoreductase n=1 Tax=Nocardioides sp. SYSU DS0663 TaxID=3416445 RepID=UPI003F4C2B3C
MGIAVVTGSASGIGRACARRLAADGFEVRGLDLAEPGVGGAGPCTRFDVTDEPAWEELARELGEGDAPVTALVTSAGILRFGSVTSCSLDDFRLVHEVNVVGTFLALKHVLPLMAKGGAGSAITISSVAGLVAKPNQLAYVAGKWGIRGMTKAAAQDMTGTGVRVNSVHPGPVRTEMTEGLPDDVFARQPIRRRADSWEVAGMVSFLAGPDSAYCTGAEFVVDGGHVLQG